MSKTVEIEFEPAYESVPDEKVEEAINDLRKRLQNFERGGIQATMRRVERNDVDRPTENESAFHTAAGQD